MRYLLIALLIFTPLAQAFAADSDIDDIRSVLAQYLPGSPDSITAAPIPGMYAATYGTDLIYITKDGRYLLSGAFYDLERGANLTEEHRTGVRRELMSEIDAQSMIVYRPKGEVKHVVTVFTDIDCVYCRRLHQGMEEMNDLGIEIRYMAFPRAGIGSPSYQKAVNVWCAGDKNLAMTAAKNNKSVETKNCENPVSEHYSTGKKMGVNSTPTMLLQGGRLIPGYVPPKRLAQMLDTVTRQAGIN